MTIFATESYGILGMLILFFILCKHHHYQDLSEDKTTLATDNKEVVNQTNDDLIPANISETWVPDYKSLYGKSKRVYQPR